MKNPGNESAPGDPEVARMRGDLLTIAKRFSHDLRTPLGGIVSSAEAIKETLAQHDPSAVRLADSVLESAEEVSQLIKQMSFVARASALPLPKITIHMAEPVFMARQRLESRVLKRGAIVKEPAEWPVVTGVAVWLEMVWWHLLLNALKHAGANCQIELGWSPQKEALLFWVADNGPGVPESLRPKLFREFHALHDDPGVPGIGLTIVQRLVELQGGKCGHEMPTTGGARFYFTVPA